MSGDAVFSYSGEKPKQVFANGCIVRVSQRRPQLNHDVDGGESLQGLPEDLADQPFASIAVNRATKRFPCCNNTQPGDGKIAVGIDAHDKHAAGECSSVRKHRLEFMALAQALHASLGAGASLPASGGV